MNKDNDPICDVVVPDDPINSSIDESEITKSKDNTISSSGIVSNIAKGVGVKIAEIIVIVLLVVGGWIFIKINPLDWNFIFWDTELKIDNTANVVERIKKISEFTTICYYEETVLKGERKIKKNNVITNFLNITPDSIHEEIVIIAKGKVRAGFDLSKIELEDVIVKSDTISIKLPYPEILEIIANPSDYETFVQDGEWEHEAIVALQVEHRNRLLKSAKDAGVFEKAVEGKGKISALFESFGFKVVNVNVENTNK